MYTYYVKSLKKVVDGDTIDVVLDLGFNLYKTERVRLAGIDTPEKRTRDLDEKKLGLDATSWLIEKLEGAVPSSKLVIRTEKNNQAGKYGRTLGWLWLESDTDSINDQMIREGYEWPYDGGKKGKNLEQLREIRRGKGTLL